VSPTDVLVRNEHHVSAPLGEALAMMDVDAGKYFLLDDVAAAVWSRLAEPVRVADLVAELRQRYDVDPEQCEADLLPFLGLLREKKLVRVAT
jgi:hypothetical protein